MKLVLEGEPAELLQRGPDVLRTLAERIAREGSIEAQAVLELLHKAEEARPAGLKQRALRELKEELDQRYRRTMDRMVSEIAQTLEQRLAKSEASLQKSDEEIWIGTPVPAWLHERFPRPEDRGGGDTSPPHLTLLYVGSVPAALKPQVVEIVAAVAEMTPQFELRMSTGVDWFKNQHGKHIAHKTVDPESARRLADIHGSLRRLIEAAGVEVQHAGSTFTPHITLAYCDREHYEGPVPDGKWLVDRFDLHGASWLEQSFLLPTPPPWPKYQAESVF